MERLLRIFTSGLLLFNGIGAIYGGYDLLAYPDGSGMKLSVDMLRHSPFHDFFIPGLILFVVNGLLSVAALLFLLLRYKKYTEIVMWQGMVLTGWIAIQIALLRTVVALHLVLGLTGLLLLYCGWRLKVMVEQRVVA